MGNRYYGRYSYDKKGSSTGAKIKLHVSMVVIIILLTFGVCFALYMIGANRESDINSKGPLVVTDPTNQADSSGDNNQNLAAIASTTYQTTTAASATEPPIPKIKNPVPESTPVGDDYFESCVFIGDSLTEGLSSYGFIPKQRVLAAQGMNIDKINTATISTNAGETTILNALTQSPAENIYIMLGSNGIAWLTNEKMVTEYSEFVDDVINALPESNIYVLSIPPVSSVAESKTSSPILNSSIDTYNSELLKMANEKEIFFVDINTALKGNDGKLPTEYASSRDGMHFQKNTYQLMIDYIKSHIVNPPEPTQTSSTAPTTSAKTEVSTTDSN